MLSFDLKTASHLGTHPLSDTCAKELMCFAMACLVAIVTAQCPTLVFSAGAMIMTWANVVKVEPQVPDTHPDPQIAGQSYEPKVACCSSDGTDDTSVAPVDVSLEPVFLNLSLALNLAASLISIAQQCQRIVSKPIAPTAITSLLHGVSDYLQAQSQPSTTDRPLSSLPRSKHAHHSWRFTSTMPRIEELDEEEQFNDETTACVTSDSNGSHVSLELPDWLQTEPREKPEKIQHSSQSKTTEQVHLIAYISNTSSVKSQDSMAQGHAATRPRLSPTTVTDQRTVPIRWFNKVIDDCHQLEKHLQVLLNIAENKRKAVKDHEKFVLPTNAKCVLSTANREWREMATSMKWVEETYMKRTCVNECHSFLFAMVESLLHRFRDDINSLKRELVPRPWARSTKPMKHTMASSWLLNRARAYRYLEVNNFNQLVMPRVPVDPVAYDPQTYGERASPLEVEAVNNAILNAVTLNDKGNEASVHLARAHHQPVWPTSISQRRVQFSGVSDWSVVEEFPKRVIGRQFRAVTEKDLVNRYDSLEPKVSSVTFHPISRRKRLTRRCLNRASSHRWRPLSVSNDYD
ncbi:hypothetical protein DICA3_C17304 [Diutina catenulata]